MKHKYLFAIVAFLLLFLGLSVDVPAQGEPRYLQLIKQRHPNFDCKMTNVLENLVLNGYGAMFISEGANFPDKCLFRSEEEVTAFQCRIKIMPGAKLKKIDYYLQPKAAAALESAFAEMGGYLKIARNYNGSTVTQPNGLNDDWAMRTYRQTQCNWIGAGSAPKNCDAAILSTINNPFIESNIIAKLTSTRLEQMFSYAIPGGSQHHFGLAIDVNDHRNGPGLDCKFRCDGALNRNGWWRTVPTDRQHFTYLGFKTREDLIANGLKRIKCGEYRYWIPDLPAEYANDFIKNKLENG